MGTLGRTLVSIATLIIAILVLLCSYCYVASTSNLGVSFITINNIELGPITIPIPIFHCILFFTWFINTPNYLISAFMVQPIRVIWPFFLGGATWLILNYVAARVMRLFANKKTSLHGSAKWATDEELEDMGLLGNTGVVLGQTFNADYEAEERKPPERKRGESVEDFRDRQLRWSPGKDFTLRRPGDLIMQQANAHTLIVGSTRSGKGVGCIIPTAFKWPESIIILDPKEENWQVTASFRARFSYTFKFQPENPKESIHYNPLLSIRRGVATMPDIQNLCLSLIALNAESKDPFWDNEARKLLAAVIGYVIYCMPPEKKTFREVYSIFTADDPDLKAEKEAEAALTEDGEEMQADKSAVQERLEFYANNTAKFIDEAKQHLMMSDDLKEQYLDRFSQSKKVREKIEKRATGLLMKEDLDNLDRIKQDLAYFASCEQRQLSSVVSTMMSNLQVIADPNVQMVTDRSDFMIEDFLDGITDDSGKARPISLYLVTSLASMQRLMPIMKIFYEQAITLLTRELKKRPYRLLLVFDEFRQMGKMEIVERALALSAGYGVLCMIVIQSYEQLKTLYQSDALFTDNFAYQVILRVNDPVTCKKIEEMLGQKTERYKKMNTSGNMGEIIHRHESFDIQELGRSLMTAEEVRTMPDDEEVIIASGMHPYKAKKVRYYLDRRFTPLYKTKNGKGSPYPEPKLEDNYPHPEILDKDPKTGKLIMKGGLDREGWHLLLGFKTDHMLLDNSSKDDGEEKFYVESDTQILDDRVENNQKNGTEDDIIILDNDSEISDIDDETISLEKDRKQ